MIFSRRNKKTEDIDTRFMDLMDHLETVYATMINKTGTNESPEALLYKSVKKLPENSLDSLLESLISVLNEGEISAILSPIVMERHFSEDFLLKYSKYLSEKDIRKNHADELDSGNYARLALLYQL